MSLPETYKAVSATENGEAIILEVPLKKPTTDQVLVKVEYAPINPTDLAKIQGFFGKNNDYTKSFNGAEGSEGSGIVVAVGENLKNPFKVGDRVHVNRGSWGQYLLANSQDISHILQEDLSLENAASHWINPATVYHMGCVAEKGGHKAAIHTAGSSALGRMLIRYFKHKGIKLINVVRREEYIEELKKEGADYVLNSQAADFEEKLKEIAEKENATIAFDAIGGDFLNKVLKAQPAGSLCLSYGALSGEDVKNVSIMELFKGKTVGGLAMWDLVAEFTKKGEFQKLTDEVHSLLPNVFSSHVQRVFKLDDLKEAIEFYQANSSKGKILLKFH